MALFLSVIGLLILPIINVIDLVQLVSMSDEAFDRIYNRTPEKAPILSSARTPFPSRQADLEELERLAALLNQGALTQEEFNAKKKQLLGL